jgi:hypothetical protein
MKNVIQRCIRLLVMAGSVALSHAALAAPVGMAVSVKGKPQAKIGGVAKPLRVLQRVSPGDTITCPAGSSAVLVIFAGGERFQVNSGASAKVGQTGVEGAKSLGALGGASARVARVLSDKPAGALYARPAQAPNWLSATGKRWMIEGERTFHWDALEVGKDKETGQPILASAYNFTLFDQQDNVVWSTRTTETQATYPADLPELRATELGNSPRLYVYRLVPLNKNNRSPLNAPTRWGVITFLRAEDAANLEAELKDLGPLITAENPDPELLALRAALYEKYHVLEMVLETYFAREPELIDATLAKISRFAWAMATPMPVETP